MTKTETKDGESKDEKDTDKSNLAGVLGRLPSAALKKICSLAQDELERRSGKDVGGMSDAEFAKYLDAQLSGKKSKKENNDE